MTGRFSVRYYCSIDFEHLGQSGRSEIAEDISNNLTKPTIADLSQREMPAPPCWNPATPLKNLTPPRWILEPSNQKAAPSNLKTAPSKQETAPSNKKTVPRKKRVVPYHLKYASLKPPPQTKRFKETTEEEIQKLFEARQTNSTKKNTTWGCKMFQGNNIYKYTNIQCLNIQTMYFDAKYCIYKCINCLNTILRVLLTWQFTITALCINIANFICRLQTSRRHLRCIKLRCQKYKTGRHCILNFFY